MYKEIEIKSITKLQIILLLSLGPTHGYKLIKEIERIQGRKPSQAHIYPFIEDLINKGYLRIKERGSRNQKVYELTEEGKEAVNLILSRFRNILEYVLKKKVNSCINCGCKIYEGGYRAEINGKEMFFCCEHCYNSFRVSLLKER